MLGLALPQAVAQPGSRSQPRRAGREQMLVKTHFLRHDLVGAGGAGGGVSGGSVIAIDHGAPS